MIRTRVLRFAKAAWQFIMEAMGSDLGEELFDQYLAANGYEVVAREPGLGTAKRPDRLIRAAQHKVVVEIKSFNPEPLPSADGPHYDLQTLTLKKVHDKISEAAKQLKNIDGYPLVVVLTNPMDAPLPLEPTLMTQVLYGDLEVVNGADGSKQWRFGRNGRLYVDGVNGPSRGNHAHVSAVCVLQKLPAEAAVTTSWMQQNAADFPNPLAAYVEALARVRPEDRSGSALRLDVFETVSRAAHRLPREVFAGRFDSRWGIVSPGIYGRLEGDARE